MALKRVNADITLEDIRKTQIIDAALKIISEVGIIKATMNDIAKAAGLSKGGIAHYFSSKEELFIEAFKDFFSRIFERGRRIMSDYSDPFDKILSFEWLFDWDDPDLEIGYPLLIEFFTLSLHKNEYTAIYKEWVNGWVQMHKSSLIQGIDRGDFCVEDIEGTARAIMSIYLGIALNWYLGKEDHSSEWAVNSFKNAITKLLKGCNG